VVFSNICKSNIKYFEKINNIIINIMFKRIYKNGQCNLPDVLLPSMKFQFAVSWTTLSVEVILPLKVLNRREGVEDETIICEKYDCME